MDANVNVGSLTQAIADGEIEALMNELIEAFRQRAALLIARFTAKAPTPKKTNELENHLFEQLRELGRQLIQWVFSQLEPELDEMPGTVSHHRKSHRRVSEKTRRSDILTRFGKISLWRGGYRLGRLQRQANACFVDQ